MISINRIIEHKLVRDVVFEMMKNLINNGEWPPETRLMEKKLAAEFQVSRTPIREAFRMLEAEGLISTELRKGIFVSGISKKEMIDILELKRELEGYASELASQKMNQDEYMLLLEVANKFAEAVRKEDYKQAILLDERFHKIIISAAGNKRLIKAIENLQEVGTRYRYDRLNYRKMVKNAEAEHLKIYQAIVEKNAENAKINTYHHIDKLKQAVLSGT